MQVRVSVVSISILFIIPRLTHSCSISFLESTLLSLIVTQNQPLSRHKHKARGSNGIDTSGLDKQIEEKRLRDAQIVQQEKQEGRSWNNSTSSSFIHTIFLTTNFTRLAPPAEYMLEFSRRLEDYEAAAKFKKNQKLQDIIQTLEEQVRQPKNNALADGQVELEKCGPSSIQIFEGEDNGHTERKKNQQQQLKGWCSELMAEKERARCEEKKMEQEYASYVLQNDAILQRMGEECVKRKEERDILQKLENMEMMRQRELRREMELKAEKEADATQARYLQNCPLLTETKDKRPDHFKGFTKDEIHKFYQDNDKVMAENEMALREKQRREHEYASYEGELLRRMDAAEKMKQERIAEHNRDYGNTLLRQREESRIRNAKTEVTGIGTGFFERFGQSCR